MLNKIAIVSFAFLLSLTACEKDNTNTPSVIGKAKITGIAYINQNLSNDDKLGSIVWEKAPAGTKLYATYSSADIVINETTGNYVNIVDSTKVDANGTYTFLVKANLKKVNVSITSDDYRLMQTSDATTSPEAKIYSLPAGQFTSVVTENEVKILDVYFSIK